MLLTLLLLTAPPTQAETIVIQNRQVEVSQISYRPGESGGEVIHSVQLQKPEVFAFPNKTAIEFQGRLTLHDNRNIWMAEGLKTKAPVSWKTPFMTLNMNCNERPQVNGIILPQRVIQFHSNGQYERGCDSLQEAKITLSEGGEVIIKPFVPVDLTSEGRLAYAREIKSGHLVNGGDAIELEPNSEVAFHHSGKPLFFTAIKGSSFQLPFIKGQKILIHQMERPVSTSLFEDGTLARGILGEPLVLNELTLPKDSAVVFEKTPTNYFLSATRLGEPLRLIIENYSLKVAQIQFTEDSKISGLEVIEDFTFYPPENPNEPLLIKAPSRLTLASNGRIVHIEVR